MKYTTFDAAIKARVNAAMQRTDPPTEAEMWDDDRREAEFIIYASQYHKDFYREWRAGRAEPTEKLVRRKP